MDPEWALGVGTWQSEWLGQDGPVQSLAHHTPCHGLCFLLRVIPTQGELPTPWDGPHQAAPCAEERGGGSFSMLAFPCGCPKPVWISE